MSLLGRGWRKLVQFGWRRILAALAVLAALASVPSWYGYNYIEHDPRFCTSCHLMNDAYGRWEHSEHSKVECHACHVASVQANLHQLWETLVKAPKDVKKHAVVDKTRCLLCHESKGKERWRRVERTRGHFVHMSGKNADGSALQCVQCHSKTVHRFAAPDGVCADCHEPIRVHDDKMGGLSCLSCHNFLARQDDGVASLLPTPADCRACHGTRSSSTAALREELDERPRAMTSSAAALVAALASKAKKIDSDSVHGRVACKRCHNPHKEKPEERRMGVSCERCHRGLFEDVLSKAPKKHQDCSSCHAPHDPPHAPRQRCIECHEDHFNPKGMHHKGECESCHIPHRFKAVPQDCAACHPANRESLASSAPKAHNACTTCHQPHDPEPTSETCAACHRSMASKVSKSPHQECTGCHQAHEGKPQGTALCSKCHEQQSHGAAAAVKSEHQACRGCHQTIHGRPETDGRACQKCHVQNAQKVLAAATPDEHKLCSSCHKPHQATLTPDETRCGECHVDQAAGAPGDKHGEKHCFQCHQPHGSPKVGPKECLSCHTSVKLVAAKASAPTAHGNCQNCHQPHGRAQKVEPQCRKCHQAQDQGQATWANTEKHKSCLSCHVAHDTVRAQACATCHAEKAQQVAGTKHARCQSCHVPHQPKPEATPAWWNGCQKCHASEVGAVRAAKTPTHKACKNCHQPHKVTPPTCMSCHTELANQLMHQVKAHQERCQDCHPTHGQPQVARPQCLACHKDKSAHYPETQTCQNCHPFKRP